MTTDKHKLPTIRLNDESADAIALLHRTCIEVGFFYLEEHGIDEELIDAVFQQSRKLFDLPEASKKALSDPVLSRGYTAMNEETLDPSKQKSGDTKEGFYFAKDIPEGDPLYNLSQLRGPNVMPSPNSTPEMEDCDEFGRVMETYFSQLSDLGYKVVQRLAMSLGLDKDHFERDFRDPMAALRLLHYDAVASDPDKGLFAAGEHSDYGMITLLTTDGTPGLQVKTMAGEWLSVPQRKNAFLVNLGDMLERWSNGLYRSTPHRVVTAGNAERYSVAFFYEPRFETVVECLPTCSSPDSPPKYPPTSSGEYLLNKYLQSHADFKPES